MNEVYDIDMLRTLLDYNPTTGEVFWAERTEDAYPNSIHPVESARIFNNNYAGRPIKFTITAYGRKSLLLRNISTTTRISFDKLLWLTISGEWVDDSIVHLDGDEDNYALTNLVLMPTQAKQAKLDKMTGITQYAIGKTTKFRARITPQGGKPLIKSGFDTVEDAYKWRVGVLKEHGLWWVKKAVNAYEENPHREKETT